MPFVLGEAFFNANPMLGTLQVRAGAEYSSYKVARGQKDSEGNIEYYTDKYGKQTETGRDYSEYYSGTTEGTTEEKSSDDIPIKNTSITPNDLRHALKNLVFFRID